MPPTRTLAARPGKAPADRRAFPRHNTGGVTCLVWAGDTAPLGARVVNLSGRGLALLVADWYEPGEELSVRLFNASVTFCLEAKLRVTRRATLPDGEYFVAGELDRTLEAAELLPFLL